MTTKRSLVWLAVAVLLIAGAVYYFLGRTSRPADAPAGPQAAGPRVSAAAGGGGGPVSVTTVPAQRRDVAVLLEATGTVTALNSVDVRPQITSVVTEVHIREGQFVKKGQPLFSLDVRNEEVNLTKARAQLAKDMASLADAERQLARSRELFAQNFVSQGAVDTNRTLVEAQQAVVASDRAAIQAAQVALSYGRITAPSAGRAGAITVFPGTLVQPGTSTLVTITQLDPIAVSFNLPQRNLGDALQTLRSGGGQVVAVLPETRNTVNGRLQFVDSSVEAATGTVRVKAQFANPDEKLWPGAFVNVRLAVQTLKDAIVVPQAAIIQAPRGKIVYVVEAGNKATARPVELVHPFGELAVVTGVQANDRVVVDGRQNLRPGAVVVERPAPGAGPGQGGRPGAPAGAASGASENGSAAGGAQGSASQAAGGSRIADSRIQP